MDSATLPISNAQLVFTVLLVLISGGIAAFLKLGLLKSLIWGTVRSFVQLTLVGYALTYIFKFNNLALTVLIITLMSYVAARTAVRKLRMFPASQPSWRFCP